MLTDFVAQGILDAIIDTGGPLDPADTYVAVSPTITNNGPATVMGDVTPATGAVATRVLVTAWGTPYRLQDGRWVVDAPIAAFRPANATEAQTVAWWYVADAATAGVLLQFGPLPYSVALPDENAQVSVVLRVTVDPSGEWSANIVFNG